MSDETANKQDWAIIPVGDGRDPAELQDQLADAGIESSIGLCVRTDQAEDARRILDGMQREADPSEALNLETIAVFQGVDAEMQSAAVQGLLEQSGISVVVEGAYGLPSLPFEVKVAGNLAPAARAILAQAEAEGPAAADAQATAAQPAES